MRLLLDTHVLLWAVMQPDKLPRRVRTTIASPENDVAFSAASIWEVAIKSGLGRVDFRVSPEEIASAASESGFTELPVYAEVCAQVARLPPHHRDPFDRLLVAQALSGPMRLFTADPQLQPYSELVERI